MKNLHYLCIAGSYSYGLNTDQSDVDIRGWYFPDKLDLLGLVNKRDSVVTDDQLDLTLFSFHKFIHNLTQCNPNAVEWIGVRREHQLYASPVARYIIDNPEMFLSKRVFYTFSGYADSMLKAIEQDKITHRNRKPPERIGKHLAHLLRLYYTGISILKVGKVDVYLDKQRELLLAVRRGEVELEKIYRMRELLQTKLQQAYDESMLPVRLDVNQVNKWVAQTTEEQLLNPIEWTGDIKHEIRNICRHGTLCNIESKG